MRPLLIALLALSALPAVAEEFGETDAPIRFQQTTRSREMNDRIRRNSDDMRESVVRWEADFLARVAHVEKTCLGSGALSPGLRCQRSGAPPPHSQDFRRPVDNAFDKAERLYRVVELMKGSRRAREAMATPGFWSAVVDIAWRSIVTDPEGANRDYQQFAGVQMEQALERAHARYEALKRKTSQAAADRGLGVDGKVALATCVSANGFTDYNQAEADLVLSGRSDPLDSSRLPWQSFATNFAPKQTGRGVCRDYAAVARDFLRAMGVTTRVVGSSGHAMTEVTYPDGVYLVEPQFDNLNTPCKLYGYAP